MEVTAHGNMSAAPDAYRWVPRKTSMHMSDKQDILRHLLATLVYRTQKALQDAPEHFGSFQAGADVRTPQELLHHMSRLISYSLDGLREDWSSQDFVDSS
jgi:hypothetical protein